MYTVIIADDELIERKALQLLLNSTFPEIKIQCTAENGIELLNAVEKYQPDIALVDINMPGISGLDAMELLIQRNAHTHFVIITAYDEFNYIKKALNMHADGFILKPCNHDELIATLRRIFDDIEEHRAEAISRQLMDEVMTTIQPIFENEILFSIMVGIPSEKNFNSYCSLHNVTFHTGTVISMRPLDQDFAISEHIHNDLRQCISQIFGRNLTFLVNITGRGLTLLLFIPETISEAAQTQWLQELLSLLQERIRQQLKLSFVLGIGGIRHDFASLPASYQESLSVLNVNHLQTISFYSGENTDSLPAITDPGKNPYVIQAVHYIHENYTKDISLEYVASVIGISSYYLSHLFKQDTGISFVKYLTNVRIQEAINLLSTNLSIAEISAQVGYLNPNYFCRIFKANTGMTIGEYRKNRL